MKSASSFDSMMSSLKSREPQKSSHDQMMATLKAREEKKKADERAGWTAGARSADQKLQKSRQDRRDVEAHITEFAETTHLSESDLEEVESMEVMTASEMLEQLVGKTREVTAKLSQEQELAREIHKMGGQVTKETRNRIKILDQKQGHLLKMHASVVTPKFMEAAQGVLRGEQLLIPKPAEWDALMADEELYLELKPESVKRPSSIELQTKEAQLQEEAVIVENELDRMIDEINAKEKMKLGKSNALAIEAYAFEADERPGIEGMMKDIYAGMRSQRQKLRDIQINLGMIRRLEG